MDLALGGRLYVYRIQKCNGYINCIRLKTKFTFTKQFHKFNKKNNNNKKSKRQGGPHL